MSNVKSKIFYTLTDEAPALATRSLLPIFQSFASACDVEVDTKDISLASRILASLKDYLKDDQKINDALAELGELVLDPSANVIKTPNISASIPQIKAAIAELQAKGFTVPNFPDDPSSDEEHKIREAYESVKGSNVNPVLREGNSDRRAPAAVKNYARKNPHSMGEWSPNSRTHVATMNGGDFRSSERSITLADDCSVKIEFTDKYGNSTTKQSGVSLLKGEVIDAMFMSKNALRDFYAEQIDDAKENDLLFSLHVKATMMKVSHPIVFGHAVTVYYKDVYEKYATLFEELNVQPNNGLGNLYGIIEQISGDLRDKIEADIMACYENRPAIAMVDSDKGISNLHVPSDVIVDASMPAMIRNSGKMWNMDGELQDTKAVIPESTYAYIYQEAIDFCKENGALDPTTIGSVSNVGLMAQKAEEYGSHDKTRSDLGFAQYIHNVGILIAGVSEEVKCVLDSLDKGSFVVALQWKDGTVEIFGFVNGLTTGDYSYNVQEGGGGTQIILSSLEDAPENNLPLIYKSAVADQETLDFDAAFAVA